MLNYIYWITLGRSTNSSDAHITRLPELSPRKAACGWLLSVSCVTFSRTMNILPCEWASGCWGPTAAHRCPVQTPPVGHSCFGRDLYIWCFSDYRMVCHGMSHHDSAYSAFHLNPHDWEQTLHAAYVTHRESLFHSPGHPLVPFVSRSWS